MDDECDFEALCDMLDGEEQKVTEDTGGQVKEQDEQDSSDDDIDEDELDRLAALVEEDENEGGQQKGDAGPKPAGPPPGETRTEEIEAKGHAVDVKQQKTEVEKSPPKEDQVPAPDSSHMDKLKELQAMQEKIKQLEAELLGKAKAENSASIPPVKEADVTKTNAGTENKPAKQTSLRPMEEDIFGAVESRSIQELQRSSKPKPLTPASQAKYVVKKAAEKKNVPQQGEDSDSDWEGLDGEKPSHLSREGKAIKEMLVKDTSKRIAHEPKYDPDQLEKINNKPYNSTWKNRPKSQTTTATSSTSNSSKTTTSSDSETFIRDEFSGIRIVNPLVSSFQMKSLMDGRRNIRISKLHTKIKTADLESDWVTIGVMVSKTEPKKSAKGNQYTIWRLNDLDECDRVVNFFLFNKVYQEHWKTMAGSVIGLLNPSIMQKEENKLSDEVSITIDNPKKLLILGRSKDMGKCRAKTKAGNDCSNVVNILKGEYCTYHVQSAYKKHSAKRSELQAGYTGVTPRSFEAKLFNKASTVIYGGQSFSTSGHTGSAAKSKNKTVSIKSLQKHHLTKAGPGGKAKVSTLQLHDIMPEDQKLLGQISKKEIEKNEKFHEALSVPTAGSMNFVKHMKQQEKIKESSKVVSKPMQAISAKDFLRQQEQELKFKMDEQRRRLTGGSGPRGLEAKPNPKNCLPSLGKGFTPGQDIFFDLGPESPKVDRNMERAKRKAIAKVHASGGIKKENPNEVKKKTSPNHRDLMRKRLAERSPEEPGSSGSNKQNEPPPKKKSRVLGGLDLDDPEVQKLLNATSSHDNSLAEQETERMEQYFEPLEKKEAMEDKMRSITEVKCKAYSCRQCKYMHFAPRKECREQQHQIITHDATKKFFKCKKCNTRTVTLDKIPKCCKKCGEQNYERCSMLKEKNGPKLPGEDLLLRGEEIKYLNSLQS